MRKPICEHKLNDNYSKRAWTKQEDEKLINYIQNHGVGSWKSLPHAAGLLRCSKSCMLRWTNYLGPEVLKRSNFGEDEDDLIIKLHALLGNRWALIAGRLPGRTENEVKKYWNSHLSRKLKNMGIDPNNHPINLITCDKSKFTTSYDMKGKDMNCQQLGHLVTGKNDDCISDAGSSLQDGSEKLPDLNLSLTIAIPPKMAIDAEEDSSKLTTLLLFQ